MLVRPPGEQEETHVVLPADSAKGNGVDVLVEDESEGDGKIEYSVALGTERVGENLESVRHD